MTASATSQGLANYALLNRWALRIRPSACMHCQAYPRISVAASLECCSIPPSLHVLSDVTDACVRGNLYDMVVNSKLGGGQCPLGLPPCK